MSNDGRYIGGDAFRNKILESLHRCPMRLRVIVNHLLWRAPYGIVRDATNTFQKRTTFRFALLRLSRKDQLKNHEVAYNIVRNIGKLNEPTACSNRRKRSDLTLIIGCYNIHLLLPDLTKKQSNKVSF